MTEYKPHDPMDLIGLAYSKALDDSMEEWQELSEKTPENLHKIIDKASVAAKHAKNLSEEEGKEISHALIRDLGHTSQHFKQFTTELKEWLDFEAKWVESDLFQRLMSAADQTRVDINEIYAKSLQSPYKTGEISGPGAYQCMQCSEIIHLDKPGRLPPCPKCHATEYKRLSSPLAQ